MTMHAPWPRPPPRLAPALPRDREPHGPCAQSPWPPILYYSCYMVCYMDPEVSQKSREDGPFERSVFSGRPWSGREDSNLRPSEPHEEK